jgi:hypothetical protein
MLINICFIWHQLAQSALSFSNVFCLGDFDLSGFAYFDLSGFAYKVVYHNQLY